MSQGKSAMITTDRAGRWIQVVNPFRPQPTDLALAKLVRRHDTVDGRAAIAGLVLAAAVGGLVAVVAPIAPALLVAVAAGVSAALGYRARYRFEVSAARERVAALDRTLGPAAVARARLTGRESAELADSAVDSADRLLRSEAIVFGALGPADEVVQDVHLQLWEIIHLTVSMDRHGSALRDVDTAALALEDADRPSQDVVAAADALQMTHLMQLRLLTHQFAAVADRCDQLDSRLRGQRVREQFAAIAGAPLLLAAETTADRLLARLSAAGEVLDAGGASH